MPSGGNVVQWWPIDDCVRCDEPAKTTTRILMNLDGESTRGEFSALTRVRVATFSKLLRRDRVRRRRFPPGQGRRAEAGMGWLADGWPGAPRALTVDVRARTPRRSDAATMPSPRDVALTKPPPRAIVGHAAATRTTGRCTGRRCELMWTLRPRPLLEAGL